MTKRVNMSRDDLVKEFMTRMGQSVDVEYSPHDIELRMDLMAEELSEINNLLVDFLVKIENGESITKADKMSLLKELADLQYVLSGTAVTFGLPLEDAFYRVHISNMSKLDDDGNPIKLPNGKIAKGPNYTPPTFWDLIDD